MAQTPALHYSAGETIDYTPSGAAVIAGQVVLIGTIPCIAESAIADGVKGSLSTSGVWRVPQAAEAISAGDAVYWDENGSPVTGTALSGAATATATGNNLMGVAVETTEATDSYVKVKLTAAKRTATIAGSVTADDITGSDATLAIAGLAAAQGGLVSVTGGASSTAANAGGAASLVGGAAGAEGVGGAASVTGGTGGTTSGTGGAASLTGGAAASAASNAVGGAASVTGGIGKGNLAGGAASLVGGVGGATGAGGAIAITGGAGGATSGTGGAVVIAAGAGSNGNANGGALTLRGGNANGSGTDGAIAIGDANTSSVTFGVMPRIPTATIAAGGTAQANANAVGEGFTKVTGSNDTAAIVLPSAVAGMQVIIKNSVADKLLIVFPAVNDKIEGGSANAAYNMANGSLRRFVAYDATDWYTDPETIA